MTPLRVDVEKLLSRLGIEGKRQGREWVALCPNREHQDRKPSWRIRDEPSSSRHGFHHCWPCGFGGSVVGLVQHLLEIDSPGQARAWIEKGAVVDQKPIEAVEVKVATQRLRFRLPPEVIVEPIEEWPAPAREYLVSRGIEEWQADRWGIGYAVHGRLKGRIVLVSRDVAGRPLRYTARSFVGEGKRYLEPEPHEKANPSAMFGEQHWPLLSGDEDRSLLFVVEGAINALALEAELPGIYVGATAGSSMRGLYGTKLCTWQRICVMTDPDAAGDRLAEEIDQTAARHARVSRLRLAEGMDPAKLRELRPGELGAIVREWLRREEERGAIPTP